MKRILVVDDDRIWRTILTRYLEKQSYQVQSTDSVVEALNLFAHNPPDLVVSDVLMPDIDGLEFCRRLRATPMGQLVPFIFLSARGQLDERVQGHLMGADDYILKPFEPRELLAKIEALLERSHRVHAEIVRLMQQFAASSVNQAISAATTALPTASAKPAAAEVISSVRESEAVTPFLLPLTPAEEKVFWEVIQGHTNKEISAHLFISPRTVQTHISHILSKLEMENRSQLIRFAFEKGYRPPRSEERMTS
jgi:DNA-binding response OmpR family regulator